FFYFCASRRRHTRCYRDWSSDVCSSDLFAIFVVQIRDVSKHLEFEQRKLRTYASDRDGRQGEDGDRGFDDYLYRGRPSLADAARSEERRVGNGRGCLSRT